MISRMGKKKFTLKPYLTAYENLFEAATSACTYILNGRHLKLLYEERQELLLDMTIATVENFLYHKIFLKKYDRNYDFWSNVHSSAWSIAGGHRIIDKFLDSIKNKLNSTSLSLQIGHDPEDTVENLIADTGTHPLFHGRDSKYVHSVTGRRVGESATAALDRIWAMDDEDMHADGFYHDYAEINAHRSEIRQRVLAKENEDKRRLSEIRRRATTEMWAKRRAKALHQDDPSPECTTDHPQTGLRQP